MDVRELKGFTRGQIDAALMKIGQDAGMGTAEGIEAFLRGDLVVSRPVCRFHEKSGVIYLSVTSNGMTGPQWIEHLEGKGFFLSKYAKQVLLSEDFQPTTSVTEIAILKGTLFNDNDRVTSRIRAEADMRKLTKPNAEVACLIRDNFTDEEIEAMGLGWIVIMHEPIKDSGGNPNLLSANRSGNGLWLSACCDDPGSGWLRGSGFAFVVSQVLVP